MVKLIIFDLDGPILDSFKVTKVSISSASKKLGATLPAAEMMLRCWGYPARITATKLFPSFSRGELDFLFQIWAEVEKKKGLKLIKGAKETLFWLKKKSYYAGLLTSRSRNLEIHLQNLDLENLFDFIQSWRNPIAEEQKLIHKKHILSSLYKPDPRVFKEIFKWTNQRDILRDEILLIDDTLVGLNAAEAVGIPFLGVCTGPLNSKEKWRQYGNLDEKYVVESIAELPKWLQKYERV